MTENMKKFLEDASGNEELKQKLVQANEDYVKNLISIADEHGYTLTKKEIADTLKSEKPTNSKLSDDELCGVTGGSYELYKDGYYSDCFCFLGGGGSADKYQKTCVCILGGCGELTDLGKKAVANGEIHPDCLSSSSAPVAFADFI